MRLPASPARATMACVLLMALVPALHSPVLLAQAPAGAPALKADDQQALSARAAEWWAARQARDHVAMYELFDPGYRRDTSFNAFVQESVGRSRFDLIFRRIEKIEPRAADRALVFVEIDTVFPQFGGPHTLTVEEPWVRVDGAWYKVHEPFRPPFPVTPPAPPKPPKPPGA